MYMYIAINALASLDEVRFLTTGPVVGIPMTLAEPPW